MKRSWIKLYLEILDDPKMGRMPDWLWRRAVELFLLAGENGNDGALQPVEDMAWRLRTSCEKLTESLQALSQVGVVHEAQPGEWVVSNFEKRQAAMTDAERAAIYRDRHRGVTSRDEERDAEGVTESSSLSQSSSVSGSSGERVQGEGKPLRAPKANEIPEVVLFRKATGWYPPTPSFGTVVNAIGKMRKRLGCEPTEQDIAPFLTAWTDRGNKKTNLAWLTEWAASGKIPQHGGSNGNNGTGNSKHSEQSRPEKAPLTDAALKAAAEINARKGRSNVPQVQ